MGRISTRPAPHTPLPYHRPMGQKKSIMRSLGEFVGHISKAVKTPAEPDKTTHELGRTTEEREATAPDGRKMTLRRTTIDEVEVSGERD